jgi:hypothetical protein
MHVAASCGHASSHVLSFVEERKEARKCSNRGEGLDLKFKVIEEMLSFLHPKKGQICADLIMSDDNPDEEG